MYSTPVCDNPTRSILVAVVLCSATAIPREVAVIDPLSIMLPYSSKMDCGAVEPTRFLYNRSTTDAPLGLAPNKIPIPSSISASYDIPPSRSFNPAPTYSLFVADSLPSKAAKNLTVFPALPSRSIAMYLSLNFNLSIFLRVSVSLPWVIFQEVFS